MAQEPSTWTFFSSAICGSPSRDWRFPTLAWPKGHSCWSLYARLLHTLLTHVVEKPCHNTCTAFSPIQKAKSMQWFKSRTAIGALMLAGAMLTPAYLSAQPRVTVTLTIEDSTGAALRGATVSTASGRFLGHSDEDGRVTFDCAAPCRLVVTAQGFSIKTVELSAGATLRLQPAVATSQLTVTAYRTPLGTLESPVTTRILSQEALATSAALTFDGQLRQLPGVELFRRSSSLVANPSSQGISLRGLGSTSASRTLIVEDDV